MPTNLHTQTFFGTVVVVSGNVVVDEVVGDTVEVVVGAAVVEVVDEVVVPGSVVVVVGATVVVVVVVVVGGVKIQAKMPGSSWPMSKAMTTERPCASANSAPMNTGPGMALMLTLIGFWPVWSRSSTPGVPTNLQTKTFFGASVVVVVPPGVVVVVPPA